MRKLSRIPILVVLSVVLCCAAVAQTASVLTGGLNTPNKLILAPENTLLVAEAGTSDPNTGRISVVDRDTGDTHTLISGLPSGPNNLGGETVASGPSGLLLQGNTLYITIATGDSVLPGAFPPLETPNPDPSSPLFDSVLAITLPGGYTSWEAPFEMTSDHQDLLAAGTAVFISNDDGQTIYVRVVANLDNYVPSFFPGFPDNVKASNLFGVEIFKKDLYINDAGRNLIHRVSIRSGTSSIFTTFPNRANPLFGTIGGPVVEAVPDNIRRHGSVLYVPLLTGFPFIQDFSEVRRVSLRGGSHEPFITGLSSAIDVAKAGDALIVDGTRSAETPGDGNSFYTLEFSTNMLGGELGRLRFYADPTADPEDVLDDLVTPTCMARDGETGDIYITNIGPGTVTKVSWD
jgi:hypothetical protein